MQVALAPRHAELVFHVLAHVPGDTPASLHDPDYVAWVERHLGPAAARPLGQDAAVLSRGLTHADAVRLQRYARVFAEPQTAVAWTTTALADVPVAALDRVDQRDALLPADAKLEVLRCGVALELDAWRRLPPVELPPEASGALAPFGAFAPRLQQLPVSVVRSLGSRGRLWDDGIWVGVPSEANLQAVGWQSAHEATLAEVSETVSLDEDAAERFSLALLAARVEEAPVAVREGHARWLADYGGLPSLSEDERARLSVLRSVT